MELEQLKKVDHKKTSQLPVLSVTITSYNYAKDLSKAIESVLAQSFIDFEVIIVDDASSDESPQIIKSYAEKDSRIRFVVHEINSGATTSLIEACQLVRGKYMVNLDSDDWILDSDAFAQQIAMFEANPELVMVFSPQAIFERDNLTRLMSAYDEDKIVDGKDAIIKVLGFYLSHTGTMIRTATYCAIGGYVPDYKYALDLKLWIDICSQGKIGYLNKILYVYNIHEGSLSELAAARQWQAEILNSVTSAFDGPLAPYLKTQPKLFRKTIQHALIAASLHHIFRGEYRKSLKFFLVSVTHHPILTIFQRATFIIFLRLILGDKVYRQVEKIKKDMQYLSLL